MNLSNDVFQLLFQFDEAVNEKHISQALKYSGSYDAKDVRGILAEDERFIDCSNNRWKCVPLDDLLSDKPIENVEFIITDIETTGSIRGKDRIIEIAAIKVCNGKVLDTFEFLVNPEKNISGQIARLTSISNETVCGAPLIEEVLPKYLEFAKSGVFVAHNSVFDFAFICSEVKRIKLESLEPHLEICTYRIARKLLPNVKACGVSGLSKHYDYPMEHRHRAMPDVLATKFFLDKFLEMLKKGKKVETLSQLIEFQRNKLSKSLLQKRIRRQRRKHIHNHSIKVSK